MNAGRVGSSSRDRRGARGRAPRMIIAPEVTVCDVCDVCGAAAVQEVRCKLICRNCGTILQSCADLAVAEGPVTR